MNDRVQTNDAEQLINETNDITELLFHVCVTNPDADGTLPLHLWQTHDDERTAIETAHDIHNDHTDFDVAVQPRINRELQDATYNLSAI